VPKQGTADLCETLVSDILSAMATMTSTPPPQTPVIARVLGPFERFAARESSGGIVLLACALVALAWANSPWAAAYLAF
jgi:hypothetical protein